MGLRDWFLGMIPEKIRADVEADSKSWVVTCNRCGHERSFWEMGGIRWKAASRGKVIFNRCPACGRFCGHRARKIELTASGEGQG